MKPDYQFGRIEKSDVPSICKFLSRVFKRAYSQEHFLWKYFGNPLGPSSSTVVSFEEEVVGFLGTIAARFIVDGNETLAGQGADIAIDEVHRRLDVFLGLMSAFESRARAEGITFTYGTSNGDVDELNSVLSFQSPICRVPRLVRLMDAGELLKRSAGSLPVKLSTAAFSWAFKRARVKKEVKPPRGARFSEVTRFDARFDRLWERMAPDKRVSVIRDSDYLNWRLIDAPQRSKQVVCLETTSGDEILGFIGLFEISDNGFRRGMIIESAVPDKEQPAVFRALLDAALQWFAKRKVGIVDCWMLTTDRWYQEARRRGFMPRQTDTARVFYHPIETCPPRVTGALADPSNWRLSISDSDQFDLLDDLRV